MKNIFMNKKIWKKIVIAILIILAFQFMVSNPVRAEGDNFQGIGGVLIEPVASLVVAIGDGITNLLHHVIMGQDTTLMPVEKESDWLAIIGAVVVGLIVAAAIIAGSILTLGVLDVILAGTAITVGSIGMGTVIFAGVAGVAAGFAMYTAQMPDKLDLPLYTYSAEEIFEGNILLFNVNFFDDGNEIFLKTKSGNSYSTRTNDTATIQEKISSEGIEKYYYEKDGKEIATSPQDSARDLHSTIAQWYVSIRNICIVIMLSVLIYIGIRMMLTSVSSEKAKYKEMIRDWIVGLCLLFVIHYIMAFSVVLVEKITEVVKTGVDQNIFIAEIPDTYDGKLEETAKELGYDDSYITTQKDADGNDIKVLIFPTNLMGKIRLEMQLQDTGNTGYYLGLIVCFLILVFFTVWFTFTYLRRLLYMAFLTIIAPLVAMTYCIDKANDGQAQGFNSWLKEYIFNLLIQPMHLLLYFILVSAAFALSGTNIVYSLVALGFMIPAEKLLRQLFGFEKAKTPPLLGGPAGTALMMQGLNKLSSVIGKGKKGEAGAEGNKAIASEDDNKAPRGKDVSTFGVLSGNASDDDNIEESGQIGAEEEQPRLFDPDDETIYTIPQSGQTDNIEGEEQPQLFNPDDQNIRMTEPDDQRQVIDNTDQIYINSQQDDETDEDNETDTRGTMRSRLATGVGRRTKSTLAGAKVAIRNAPAAVGKRAFKTARKAVVGGAVGIPLGATAAMLGTASAIASGEPKHIGTTAATSAGIAYMAGSRAANAKATSHISAETRAAYNEVYHGEEYRKLDAEKASKEKRKDAVNKLKVEQELSKEEAKEFMKDQGELDQMLQAGIPDIDTALVLKKGMKEHHFKDVDDAVAHYQLYDNLGRRNPETQKDFDTIVQKGLVGRGVNQDTATKESKRIKTSIGFLHGELNK